MFCQACVDTPVNLAYLCWITGKGCAVHHAFSVFSWFVPFFDNEPQFVFILKKVSFLWEGNHCKAQRQIFLLQAISLSQDWHLFSINTNWVALWSTRKQENAGKEECTATPSPVIQHKWSNICKPNCQVCQHVLIEHKKKISDHRPWFGNSKAFVSLWRMSFSVGL